MKTAIMTSDSDHEFQLLIDLANKLGIKVIELTEEQLEDYGLARAIKDGKTGEFIDADKFISYLKG